MRRALLILAVLAYVCLFLWAYAELIAPAFTYWGYNVNWPGTAPFAILIFLCLLPAAVLPHALEYPSQLIAWWLYMTVYIPAVLLPALSLTMGTYRLMPLVLSMLACLLLLLLVSLVPVLRLPRFRVSSRIFWATTIAFWIASTLFVESHFRPSAVAANLASLFVGGSEYAIREQFLGQLSAGGRVLGYVTGQIGEALNPFFLAYGLVHRKRSLIVLGIVGQALIFAVLGAKSIFFSSFFIVLVYFVMKWFRRNFGLALVCLLIAVISGSALVDRTLDNSFLSSITTRRTLMDPGILTGFYYEHYSQVSHAGIAYHFPNPGAAVPAPSYEIGLVYFGDERIDANANLWAEGFADLGIPGVFLFSLLLAGIAWMYDSIGRLHSRELTILMTSMQAFAFSNSAPLTTFLTHGGLLSAFLLWLAPDDFPAQATGPGPEEEAEFPLVMEGVLA